MSKDILGNVIAHDLVTYKINGQSDKITLQALQSARDEAEDYRLSAMTLRAENAALREALTRFVVVGECIQHGERNGVVMGEISIATDKARAALAGKDGL